MLRQRLRWQSRQFCQNRNMKVTDFTVKINKKNVFSQIDCYEDSPVYDEVDREYHEIIEQIYEKIDARALLEFGDISDYDVSEYGDGITEALFCIVTVGGKISEWITGLFEQGEYVKAMLADAAVDDYLFQMENQLKEKIIQMCRQAKRGVIRRLEAPQDIDMSVQKKALEVTNAEQEIGLTVKESYMYSPVKTVCQVFLLDDKAEEYRIEHDCSKCPNVQCKMRNIPGIPIEVVSSQGARKVMNKTGQSLMETFRKEGIFVDAVCGGNGICGKCKVQMLEGNLIPSKSDRIFFHEIELEKGYRLACTAYPERPCKIALEIRDEEAAFDILSEYEGMKTEEGGQPKENETSRWGIAVDIGTTTIVMQLVDIENKLVMDTCSVINHQRDYGADVISRIKASNFGKKRELRESIRRDLKQGLASLPLNGRKIEQMVIAANTTMVHLLMGYSCMTLGVLPFQPVNIKEIHTDYAALFSESSYEFPIVILPGISTFVGGDIVSGLYACDFDRRDEVSILIDLGTNGEMAIGNKERILTASAAAGPAFEGGNIACGTGSIQGAICGVKIEDGEVLIQTIGSAPPTGICGTGVIDSVYELLKNEVVDETGRMQEEYSETGFRLAKRSDEAEIVVNQKDVREIQLAKSAVRAGVETLIAEYGIDYENISRIYIAGGFGYKLNIAKAIGIGLLPQNFSGEIIAIGNSSLKGAVKYLMEDKKERMQEIVSRATEVNLSGSKDFQRFYVDYMWFESSGLSK